MRATLLGLTLLYLSGCMDPAEMFETERKTTVTPPGIAPVEDMAGVQPAAKSTPAKAKQPATPPAKKRPPQGDEKRSIIGQKTKQILDAKQATKNGGMVVVSSKVSGSDPLTQLGSAYTRGASFAGSLPLKQWLQQHKALNNRYPTYDELIDWMKKNPRVELPVLPAHRTYGYDSDKGEIVVLEEKGN